MSFPGSNTNDELRQGRSSPRVGIVGLLVVIFFGLLWSSLVLLADSILIRDALRQIQALGFPTTPGVITKSEVDVRYSNANSKPRIRYNLELEYTYAVDGRSYTGSRYRYGQQNPGDSRWAKGVVADFPPGREIDVHYAPANPQESLLRPGIHGSDLCALLFLNPFNAIMLSLWSLGWFALQKRRRPIETGQVPWHDDGVRLSVHLPRIHPFLLFLSCTGAASLLLTFLIIFTVGTNPSTGFMVLVWAALLGGCGYAALRQHRSISGGACDFVIDRNTKTVEIPATFGRKEKISYPLADVSSADVKAILQRSTKGATSYTYAVMVHGRPAGQKIAEWPDEQRARNFASWLNDQLKSARP